MPIDRRAGTLFQLLEHRSTSLPHRFTTIFGPAAPEALTWSTYGDDARRRSAADPRASAQTLPPAAAASAEDPRVSHAATHAAQCGLAGDAALVRPDRRPRHHRRPRHPGHSAAQRARPGWH